MSGERLHKNNQERILKKQKQKREKKYNLHNNLKYKQNKPKGYHEAQGPNKDIFLQLVSLQSKPIENLKMWHKTTALVPQIHKSFTFWYICSSLPICDYLCICTRILCFSKPFESC